MGPESHVSNMLRGIPSGKAIQVEVVLPKEATSNVSIT